MSLVDNVRDLAGPYSRIRIPHFDNVPYLRRFRVGGKVFITSFVDPIRSCAGVSSHLLYRDHLPEPPHKLVASSRNSDLNELSVDSMVIDGNMVSWYDVKGRGFFVEGHYPISAGYDRHGNSLYIAAVKRKFVFYFTCVKDGASTARYTDEIGDTHETNNFVVLVLRHDPTDLMPTYPRIPGGAMDQTGPLFWLKFWPQKNPDYSPTSDSAKSDDNHLESLLDSYDSKTDLWMWG